MRWKTWLKRGVVASVLVCVFGITGMGLANVYVKRVADDGLYTLEDTRLPARHTAIVLGARVMASGEPSTALEDRLYTALKLYRAGKVERILVTGDHGRRGYNEVAAMFRWLLQRGVPARHIFVDHAGFRTFDSMYRASEVFEVKEAIVCTQQFHLARSVFLARKHGIDAVGVAADRRVYAKRRADATREFIARAVAVGDVFVWRRDVKFGGDKIAIHGDASKSWDEVIEKIARGG